MSGHEVRIAHDGPEALDTARQFQPEVVFLDIGLPTMDGYEVARRMREQPSLAGASLSPSPAGGAMTTSGNQEKPGSTST